MWVDVDFIDKPLNEPQTAVLVAVNYNQYESKC